MRRLLYAIGGAVILLSGCATPTYRQVFTEKPAGNFREFCVSKDILYASVSKVLCEKNFLIENEDKDKGFILGKRSFQQGRKTLVLLIQGKIVEDIPGRSTLYVNAIETTETYYVSDHTRFFMFIIPLPGGGGKNVSTVKQAEKTIQDKRFYQDFFAEIDSKVKDMQAYRSVDAGKQPPVAPEAKPQPAVDPGADSVVANQTGA
jgi:hypothetical protein